MAFAYRNGVLCAEQVSLEDLARSCGTPCYVYSRAAIEHGYGQFAEALQGRRALVAYSVKANSNLAVLALLARLGAGFDIGAYELGQGQSLTAAITTSPDAGPAPLTVQFTGNASGGLPPYAFAWDFGDGASSTQATTSHTFISSGIFNVLLVVTDALNHQITVSRGIKVEANLAPIPSVVDVAITRPEKTEVLSMADRGTWYDMYMYFDNWDNISYADIWINHESSSEGSVENRGGRFFSDSNYKMSYSISTAEIWAGQKEGSSAGTNITGTLGLYVDDDGDEYEQNSNEQWAKARFRLLDNALTGTWRMNAYVVSKDNKVSGLFQKTFRVSTSVDNVAPFPPRALRAVLEIIP